MKKTPLVSTAFIRFLDLLGEGELEGFPSARGITRDTAEYNTALLKDVYFDKTPVLRSSASTSSPSDDDFNFRNVTLTARYGTADQDYIPAFARVENETAVGVVVDADSPVTRSITDTDVDRVAVILNFPALQKITGEGKVKGSSVNYRIQVAYDGGAFTTVVDSIVTGRAREPYQRTDTITITGAFPVDIKVIRVTEDSTDINTQNAFSWLGYTEITDAKLSYRYSALVGLELSAKDFGQLPVRSYRVRGIRIKLPTNATVDYENGRVTYSGIWDGTFGPATWCSDPAWCLWDLLTNCRYGFNLATRDLDKFSFYQASVYCNELVSNGVGGEEPRFSCNISIQNLTEAYKLINDMCSVFRAMPYWSAGSVMVAQDRPSDPVYLFNQTNVTEEGFQYTGSSLKTRHTVAVVGYLDLENQEIAYESVEDIEGIARYGVITAEITAFACTSRSQAYRLGEWLLYTEQYENETVTFRASMDAGINVRPGMIIAISDPTRSGVRRGGRITAAGSNYVVIDEVAATNLPLGSSPQILVALTDGTVATETVTGVSGPKITISGTFAVAPLVGGVFIYNDNSMSSTTWRVVGAQEQNGTEYSINAVSYNVSKYDYIERGRSLVIKTYLPQATLVPVAPINASATVASYVEGGQLQNTLIVDWQGSPSAVEYEVSYRLVDE
jgi:predicted phage tail protein